MTRVPALCAALFFAAAGAAAGGDGLVPTPIGVERRFHPAPASERVLHAAPVGSLRCVAGGERFGVHVELFARRRVVIVPAGIGIARPLARDGAYVRPRGCSYPARTLAPTGVVEVRRGARLTLGDLFDVWGARLSATRLAGFRTTAARPVRAYVDGVRLRGALRAIPLRRHAEIVLELGPFGSNLPEPVRDDDRSLDPGLDALADHAASRTPPSRQSDTRSRP